MSGPGDFWHSFGDDSEFQEVTCGDDSSLAQKVLNTFGIPCADSTGGSLPDLDIKRMDAIQVIKLSLLETSANDGKIYEPVMNEQGQVEFVAVGTFNGLSGGEIYYEIQSGSYIENCGGVMVTGAKPLMYRRPVEWKPIWEGGTKEIYDTGLLINEHCLAGDFSQQATIVFNDPHLDTSYEDGIDNLYEITSENPYDVVMGYARYIDWPDWENGIDVTINRQSTAKILLPLPNSFGTQFIRRPVMEADILTNPACYQGQGIEPPDSTIGVPVDIPSTFRYETVRGVVEDKLQGILDVYVVGLEINDMRGVPPTELDALLPEPQEGSANCWVKIENTNTECWRLERGTHYVVGYEELDDIGKKAYIVFANNSRSEDPIKIESSIETNFFIDPECSYADITGSTVGTGFILPTSPTGGILVKEMFVSVLLETPSIVVYHPDGWNRKAEEIANNLTYMVAPLIVVEEPRPIAFNGTILNMVDSIQDHDPTTAQDFNDTDFERALDEMEGNGMSISLSFLNEEQCINLSSALYDFMNSGDGIESTYVCSPDTSVKLGGIAPNGGIINSINYSYQDQNSYTISVNAGSNILGNISQIDGGPAPMRTEDVSAQGTVIQDMGNHIYYKVRLDEFGERLAINMSPNVIRVGDKVSCSVHNNPVES